MAKAGKIRTLNKSTRRLMRLVSLISWKHSKSIKCTFKNEKGSTFWLFRFEIEVIWDLNGIVKSCMGRSIESTLDFAILFFTRWAENIFKQIRSSLNIWFDNPARVRCDLEKIICLSFLVLARPHRGFQTSSNGMFGWSAEWTGACWCTLPVCERRDNKGDIKILTWKDEEGEAVFLVERVG